MCRYNYVVLARLKGEETLEVVVAECTKKLEENLKVYDKILSKQKYLAGDVSPAMPSSNSST